MDEVVPEEQPTSQVFLDEIRIDLRTEETGVYFFLRLEDKDGQGRDGFETGWRYKAFPKGMGIAHIMVHGCADHIEWPIKDPPGEGEGEGGPLIFLGPASRALNG